MKLLIVLLLTVNIYATTLKYELNHLSIEQYKIIVKIYTKKKDSIHLYSLLAIAWKESDLGRYLVNLDDPSAGCFHNLLSSVIAREKRNNNSWVQSRVLEKLVTDFDYGLYHATAELNFWDKLYTEKPIKGLPNWRAVISSYNAGHTYKNGKAYMLDIVERVKVLKVFIANNKVLLDSY